MNAFKVYSFLLVIQLFDADYFDFEHRKDILKKYITRLKVTCLSSVLEDCFYIFLEDFNVLLRGLMLHGIL